MINIKPNKIKLNNYLPVDMKNKLTNKGKSKIGESLNNYNALREAIDNEMQYKVKVDEKKKTLSKFKIT